MDEERSLSDAALDLEIQRALAVDPSPEFLAPGDQPANAEVFNASIRYMVVPPFIEQRIELVEAVTPLLDRLVTAPGILDLETITEQIDQASRTVLSPEDAEEGFWMRRPRPDLEIEWLLQQAPVRGPEGREFENEILKRQSGEQSVDQA